MARLVSNDLMHGKKAPHFNLLNTVNGKKETLNELKGAKGTALFFICNHCPFVLHINEELVKMANTYQKKGINFIAISSNDTEAYPQDAPQLMKELAEELRYPFPYLYDETQEIAKAYDAVCTPDIFLFDGDLTAVYHGQLDASRPDNGVKVTGEDLRYAMGCLLENKENAKPIVPSVGCSIKWK